MEPNLMTAHTEKTARPFTAYDTRCKPGTRRMICATTRRAHWGTREIVGLAREVKRRRISCGITPRLTIKKAIPRAGHYKMLRGLAETGARHTIAGLMRRFGWTRRVVERRVQLLCNACLLLRHPSKSGNAYSITVKGRKLAALPIESLQRALLLLDLGKVRP